MADPLCRVREDAIFKSDKVNQFCLNELEDEKRFISDLEHQESLKSAGDVRGLEKTQLTLISTELRKEKIKEFLEKKRRQQLVQSTEELRHLNRQVGFAISFKQLTEQSKQRELARQEQMLKKNAEETAMKQKFEDDNNKYLDKEKEERALKAEHRKFLLKQIEEIQKKRKQDIKEITEDRERIQRVLDMYDAREAEEKQRERDLKKETKIELDKIVANQKVIEMALREQEEELIKRGHEYVALKDRQQFEREAAKKEAFRKKDVLCDAFGARYGAEIEEKKKREKVLDDLLIKERKAINDAKYRQELMQRKRDSLLLRREMLEHINTRSVTRMANTQNEIREYRETAAKLAKALEETTQQQLAKKKQEQKELRAELFDAMNYKSHQTTHRFVEKKLEEEKRVKIETKRLQDINEERLKILKAQPKEVLKFLPPRALSEAEKIELGLRIKE